MATIDFAALSIADTVTSGKGKSAQISYNGAPVYWKPGDLQVAFEPGAFNGEPASRVNMVFRATPVQDTLTSLDMFIVNYVHLAAARILGKEATKDEVKSRYVPCLKTSDKYEPTFKCKVNLEEPYKVKLWGDDRKPRESPASWQGLMVAPKLRLKGLWIMGRDFGALWEATDLMFEDQAPECPF
jgi:hypothetical protein